MTARLLHRISSRLRDERGFTMIIALGILTIAALLTGALFVAVNGEASFARSDLDGNRAYAAAQSGAQAYLYQLNAHAADSSWWQTCSNDTLAATSVPGTTGEQYSYTPVVKCVQGKAVGTVVDPTTGLLRMEFTGTAGQYGQHRTIVASFRPLSPLSFMWYTVHEAEDPSANSSCPNPEPFYRQGGIPDNCKIEWAPGDVVNGPMYTQDQFLIDSGASPIKGPFFGRANSSDAIASSAPTATVCAEVTRCPTGLIRGKEEAGAQVVPLPSDNANLLTDATAHGVVLYGTTTLTLSGATASATSCLTNDSTKCTTQTINLSTKPIIYGATASGATCVRPTYSAASGVSYPSLGSTGLYYGACGDIYVQGHYSVPLTIASADDIVLTGNVTNDTFSGTTPAGLATMGLVADEYVRVQHTCGAQATTARTIEAAILTLQHSFIVDNYGCGSPQSQLTVVGAIAQQYRGPVGTAEGTGYLKNYNYDDRLGLLLPPYLFDLQNTSWQVVRQTLCGAGLPKTDSGSCAYQGT